MAEDAAARAYIQEAVDLIANQDYDRAAAKLELADVELEDLTGGARNAVAALLKETQAAIVAARSNQHRPRYLRMLNGLLDEAESDIGNLVTWPGSERKTNELYADTTAAACIPEELEAARGKFNTFKKLHARKASAAIVEQIENDVKSAEEQWNDTKADFDEHSPPGPNNYAVEKSRRYVDDARKRLSQLPADNEHALRLGARLDTIMAEITDIGASAAAKEMVAQLERQSQLYENEWEGWEDEADGAPTWEEYAAQNSDRMEAFGAPRTRKFRERIEDFLNNLEDDSDYEAVASTSSVKTVVDSVRERLGRAKGSLLQRIHSIVPHALSASVKDEYHYERLERDIERTLGDKCEEAAPMLAKVRAKIAAHQSGVAYEQQTSADQLDTLYLKADEVWPSLHAGLSWADSIDLKSVGQNIGFMSNNLVGYRFNPGAYYFATTIGDVPVAGKMDARMLAGIKETEALLGRSLGDDDRDGQWDIVATVTDGKATLQARKHVESTGSVGGLNVSASHAYAESVQAVVIEILAAKCGPFAGAKVRGVLNTDGTVS